MDFLHSRAERVAAHVRDGIVRGDWKEPLPNSRDWARSLGISRTTLYRALALLQKEGLLQVEKRQCIRLRQADTERKDTHRLKAVRVVYYGHDYPGLTSLLLPWIGPLLVQLQQYQIHFSLEKCSDERLRQLCSGKHSRDSHLDELLLPLSIGGKYQKLLAASGRPAFLLGEPASGIELPNVNADLAGAMRHAVHHLLRRGFSKTTLLLDDANAPGNQPIRQAFEVACKRWPHQPVDFEIVRVPMCTDAERTTYSRFADRLKTRQGILIVPPLSVALLMTTLLSRGISIPGKVEIVVVMSLPESIRVHPQPTHYPCPSDAFAKTISDAAVHFFETGLVPPIHKVLPMEMVPAS